MNAEHIQPSAWQGSVITGEEGTKLLLHFSKKADKKQTQELCSKLGAQYANFEPWMSHPTMYQEFAKLSSLGNDYRSEKGLRARKELFSNSAQFNLAHISPRDDWHTIMLPSEKDYEVFLKELAKAQSIFMGCTPYWTARVDELVSEIIPLMSNSPDRFLRENGSGLSTLLYRKGIFLGLPKASPIATFELALNLAHEVGHQALMVYELFDDLIQGDQNCQTYSVIRKTNRPAIQSLHALTAVAYMLEFALYAGTSLKNTCSEAYYNERIAGLKADLKEGIKSFENIPLTKLGKRILSEYTAFYLWLN